MTQLTDHFSLEELTTSTVADRRGIDNSAPIELLPVLTDTAARMEAVRTLLNSCPIHVDSGYRSPEVNSIVGGVPDSAHLTGHAVDFIPCGWDLNEAAQRIADSSLEFDQVIREFGWIHVSFDPRFRRQVMTKKSASTGYLAGIVV